MPGVGLGDCERLSRELGDRIDALPFFEAPYDFQVSSPGIDRPIRSDDDLRRNTGRPVRVEFRDENGKVSEIHGMLAGTDGNEIARIDCEDGEKRIARDHIVLMKQDAPFAGRKRNKA
jgi:ribosome maturation factor RimP